MAKKETRRRTVAQRQIAISLPDGARDRLEAAAKTAGHSIAEEIRVRLARTFDEEAIDQETRKLMDAIEVLAELIRVQTGHRWYAHPAATSVMRYAVFYRLVRLPGGDGEAKFLPDDLPDKKDRLLDGPSDEPADIALHIGTASEVITDLAAQYGIGPVAFMTSWIETKAKSKAGESDGS